MNIDNKDDVRASIAMTKEKLSYWQWYNKNKTDINLHNTYHKVNNQLDQQLYEQLAEQIYWRLDEHFQR